MFKKLINYFKNKRRERILYELFSSVKGKERLAAAMANPIRERLNYESVARRALEVQPMPEGALPFFQSERVTVPEFEEYSASRISLEALMNRRFDLSARSKHKEEKLEQSLPVFKKNKRKFRFILKTHE